MYKIVESLVVYLKLTLCVNYTGFKINFKNQKKEKHALMTTDH